MESLRKDISMKNRFFKIFIAVLLIAVMALPLFSCGSKNQNTSGTWGDFKWSFSDGTLYVSGSGKLPTEESSKNVGWASVRESVVRVVFDGKVTAFSDYAFYGMSNLKSITMPSDAEVKSIGKATFAFCTSLTGYKIPDTVTSIGASAFEGCVNLKQIKIPAGVTSIGERAFMYCRSLTSFVAMGNKIASIGKWTFNDCRALNTVVLQKFKAEGAVETVNVVISDSAFEKAKIGKGDIVYTNAIDGKVTITVNFVDENENLIKQDVHTGGVLGDTYKYEAKEFDGYTLVSDKTVSVTALTGTEEVTFKYKKNEVVTPPVTETPDETPSTDNADTSAPAETNKSTEATESGKSEDKNSTTTVIALIIFGVVIVGICVGAFLLIRSDKKQKKNGTTVRKNVDTKNKKNGKRK